MFRRQRGRLLGGITREDFTEEVEFNRVWFRLRGKSCPGGGFVCTASQTWDARPVRGPEAASTEADQIARLRDTGPALCRG